MSAFDVRDIMKAAGPASANAGTGVGAQDRPLRVERPKAVSPLVLCGTVRILEAVTLLGFGILLYAVMLHGRIGCRA